MYADLENQGYPPDEIDMQREERKLWAQLDEVQEYLADYLTPNALRRFIQCFSVDDLKEWETWQQMRSALR